MDFSSTLDIGGLETGPDAVTYTTLFSFMSLYQTSGYLHKEYSVVYGKSALCLWDVSLGYIKALWRPTFVQHGF